MKNFVTLLIVFCAVALPRSTSAQADNDIQHYVVIGAFSKIDNAIRWTDQANNANFSAQYAINEGRGLYYVYILRTDDKRAAFKFMMKIRVETKYKDAWVFSGRLGKNEDTAVEQQPVVEETPVEQPVEEPVVEETPVEEEPEEQPVEEPVEEKPAGKPFMFKLVSANEEVLGEVHILESPTASQYQAFNGNEVVYLTAPRNSERAFIVSVQAPGYRPVDLTVSWDDPAVLSSGIGPQSENIIPVELVRSKRGDYIEFNRVRFFGNSAIFTPESRPELDGLVDLMKEQPKYKIMVHGHCNGKQSRNIVTKGSSNEFFETSTLNSRETVSAKQLTQYRADMVKDYLVSQGIEAKRIKTKAEGGKVMIYPQGSTLSGYNDRIEVEIKKGK
ncbi:MAG: OmpA family protein [Cyclobacteriaceae bacterium]